MKNPYEVLSVTSSASMDEIKRAYRDKARRYSENQAKMDELNDAYDFIINNFGSNKGNTSYADSGYGAGAAGGQTSEFGDIRAKLNSGRIDDAEMLLDGIPYQRRNAEWYYLKGTIQHRKGWLESALENFRKAKEMEPGNSEYEAAFNQLERESKGDFRRNRQNEDNDGCCSPCNICSSLMCADCCCECMGGDLIRCC
ncbi:MAG: molecular chaperone DnaJ [Oscillospiraceae bacterium]|nr:J domain-containing protein [Ruminococcus sp.]MDY3088345.1 molecular chaperone DnaJ [Oscillospiraceae bacterium]